MKNRRHRRLVQGISKLHAGLDAVKKRDLNLRQDLEIATATLEGAEANEKVRLEARVRMQLVEVEKEVNRALKFVNTARRAAKKAKKTAKASRHSTYMLEFVISIWFSL